MSKITGSIGLDYYAEEIEKMSPRALTIFERQLANEYVRRHLQSLTIEEIKKCILMTKRQKRVLKLD